MNKCENCKFANNCFSKADVMVEVKDKTQIYSLIQYGEINYVSNYLNIVGMTNVKCMLDILQDQNVIDVESSCEGEYFI